LKLPYTKLDADNFLSAISIGGSNNYINAAIPYKTSKTPFQEHGLDEGLIISVFCLLALGVYVFLRKKGLEQLSFVKDKKIKVIERTKITTRSSILLVQYKNRFFLMSQSVDNLTLISDK
jgi:hypothetical protein